MNKELIASLEDLAKLFERKSKETKDLASKATYLEACSMANEALINHLKKVNQIK